MRTPPGTRVARGRPGISAAGSRGDPPCRLRVRSCGRRATADPSRRGPARWFGRRAVGLGWTNLGWGGRSARGSRNGRSSHRMDSATVAGASRARAAGNGFAPARFHRGTRRGNYERKKKKKMGGALAAGGARRWGAHLSAARLDATALARALEPEHRGEAVGHGGGGHRVRGVPASKIGRSELSTCLTDCRNSRSGRCERGYVGARVLSSVPRVRDPRAGIDTRS